jgi:hypothetical protein
VRQSDRDPLDTFTMLEEAMSLAQRTEEQKLVLGGLADVRHAQALEMAASYLADEALRDEAAIAMASIARKLAAEQGDVARQAVETARAAATSETVRQQIDETVAFIERFTGYSAAWLIAGPYFEKGKKSSDLFDMAFPPEIDDAPAVEWRPLPINNNDNPWIFDLHKAIGDQSRCVYVKTSAWSDQEQPARLEIGSDDCVKVWLNGELVHSNRAYRVVTPADDRVNVTLNEGWNTLLMKIVQGGGGWGFCAGFKAPDGAPLPGVRFKAGQ